METLTRKIYTYAVPNEDGSAYFSIQVLPGMDSQGWLLVDTREISIEVESADYYAKQMKQVRLDAALLAQEKINAQVLELTS